MTGSALFIYALLALHGGRRWLAIAAAVFFLGMAAVCLYSISLASRARPAIPAPDGKRLFSGMENPTYDDIAARLLPYMERYFACMQSPSGGFPLSPPLDRLIWPYWFIEIIHRYDADNFSALLSCDKSVVDFLCDRLFDVGMDEAVRRLQYYRASAPALDAEARAWFQSEAPHLKDILVDYVRRHRDAY